MLVLIVLWAVIYMAGLSRAALLDDADTVHAEAAREMLQRHDWVTLYANGIRYLEKAPLMYWGVATSYTLFGVSEWSTRFPLMLGVLAMILSTYGLGRWALGSEGGFDSGLVLATALGPFLFTRFLIPDVAVGLWLTLTFWLFLISLEQPKPARWTCWGIGAMCALNVLTKGLIGLVFPIGAIGLYLLLTGNLRHLLQAAPRFQRAGIFRDRCAVAYSSRPPQSSAGKCPRVSVVLFCQRAHPALPEPARSARLR